MKAHPLSISGSWKIEFKKFDDNRGFFYESFKEEDFKNAIGRSLDIKQIYALNISGKQTNKLAKILNVKIDYKNNNAK
jgi:dTDP-4-dehydrorhamnose 3,5-epimerase-like enzyme